MVRDTDSIERDIERARQSLASTLDQLGTRANPKQLADNAKAGLRSKFEDPKIKYPVIAAGVIVGLLVVRKLLR